jgi:acetate---CoA ligase (ADP-forming)
MKRPVGDLLFRPKSVAVVGASSDPAKLSGRPLHYLKTLGFGGQIYAVNPHRTSVQGMETYPDISQVPGPVDLAIIVVPADSVASAVERCADAGVGAAIIFASGFAEMDQAGAALQQRLTEISRSSGLRILGPNCLGTFSIASRTFATFSTAFDDNLGTLPTSPVALISQSGAVGTFTYSTMIGTGVGLNYFANTGNEADLTVTEVLSSLIDAPDVEVLLGHMEGVQDFGALERLARRADQRGKPLVLLKTGHTDAGARAVAAHTSSIAGDDAAFNQILERHGVVRVHSLEAWADAGLAFSAGRHGQGRRLTIITLSGGAGALAADAAVDSGLQVDTWADEAARGGVAAELPPFGSVSNPIDLTGSMINDVGILRRVLDLAAGHDESDALLVVLGNADAAADEVVEVLKLAYPATAKPFMVSWTGGSGAPRRALLEAGIPTFTDPVRAVAAMKHVLERGVRDAELRRPVVGAAS